MPDCLREDDSISAMLERGTINRDFALSMQALGFGDEPMTYKEARLRPDSHEWALLSKAAIKNYNIRQLDIGNAYLCAIMSKRMYSALHRRVENVLDMSCILRKLYMVLRTLPRHGSTLLVAILRN